MLETLACLKTDSNYHHFSKLWTRSFKIQSRSFEQLNGWFVILSSFKTEVLVWITWLQPWRSRRSKCMRCIEKRQANTNTNTNTNTNANANTTSCCSEHWVDKLFWRHRSLGRHRLISAPDVLKPPWLALSLPPSPYYCKCDVNESLELVEVVNDVNNDDPTDQENDVYNWNDASNDAIVSFTSQWLARTYQPCTINKAVRHMFIIYDFDKNVLH